MLLKIFLLSANGSIHHCTGWIYGAVYTHSLADHTLGCISGYARRKAMPAVTIHFSITVLYCMLNILTLLIASDGIQRN